MYGQHIIMKQQQTGKPHYFAHNTCDLNKIRPTKDVTEGQNLFYNVKTIIRNQWAKENGYIKHSTIYIPNVGSS